MHFDRLKRRDIITLLGGAAAAWPLVVRAQHQLGWLFGRNIQVDIHWGRGDPGEIRRLAAGLAAQAPDAILAHGSDTLSARLQATRTLPIVFAVVSDPVGA